MTTLLLKFGLVLVDHDIPIAARHHGPVFHRWLPDGEKDAIALDPRDPSAELNVWFERMGFVDGGFIKFSYERREVDPDIVPRQAILDGGPLMGLLKIRGLSKEQLAAVRDSRIGDPHYMALGKTVVKRLLYPPVSRFLSTLRTNYGQYWIRELEKWDSRKQSLGAYCSLPLQLLWSLDGGETWARFRPDEPAEQLLVTIREDFSEYLSSQDWQQLAEVAREGHEPSTGALILARTHQLLDQGNLKHGLIEGVSALELALSEFMRRKMRGADLLIDSMQAFWNLPLPSRLVAIASVLESISLQHIEHTVEAIKMRNRVVHEGWNPTDEADPHLSGLLTTVAGLLTGPSIRFPCAAPGNALMSEEQWEELAQEQSQGG